MAELTDDHIEKLFTELRAGQLHLVRPPGAAKAHSTVRRRHRKAYLAATLTVLTVAAATIAGNNVKFANAQAAGHPVDRQQSPTLGDLALAALPPAVERGGQQSTLERRVIFMPTGPTDYEDVPIPRLEGVTPRSAAKGTYAIDVSCAGAGSARFMVSSTPATWQGDVQRTEHGPAQAVTTTETTCSTKPMSQRLILPQRAAGFLRVAVHANSDTAGMAAVAYMVTRIRLE